LVSVFRNFAHLPAAQRSLFLRAAWLLLLTTAAVKLLRFRTANRLLRREVAANPGQFSPETICWAVSAAARRIPGCNCLPQALAGAHLLRANGIAADVVLGVATQASRLDAHAWIVHGNRVLLGGAMSEQRYTVLTREVLDV
jgi:hypothetical protein